MELRFKNNILDIAIYVHTNTAGDLVAKPWAKQDFIFGLESLDPRQQCIGAHFSSCCPIPLEIDTLPTYAFPFTKMKKNITIYIYTHTLKYNTYVLFLGSFLKILLCKFFLMR